MGRLCIVKKAGDTVYKYEDMSPYIAWAIVTEVQWAMRMFRMGYEMDPRQEASEDSEEQKICVEYDDDTQQFTWVRKGITALDTEIACLIAEELIKQEIFKEEEDGGLDK